MQDAKEEIKARLPVEDVVGQYIELKRAGRNLKGRSPWGVDKTPSFMVSPEKGIWHDFSANKGGDIFSFVMEVEGISFREALEKLARQAGVTLKQYEGGDRKIAEKKKRMRECLEWATKYYQVCLAKNKNVCEYVFYKRNLNRKTAVEFRLGYAPKGRSNLVDFLKKKGFSKEEIEETGLTNRFEGDFFKERMMVPFMDMGGQVIGFTGRIIGQGEPKYLNTPETLLFKKSRFIFGLEQAKSAIRRNGFVVIVEGNMDVISSHQAGVKEAVATSGTAMTEIHLKTLERLTDDIRLAFDGDEAGVRAAERVIEMAEKMGVEVSIVADYMGAKDPDELIQRDPKLWQEAVAGREPAIDWLLGKYEERVDMMSGTGVGAYFKMAINLFNKIQNPAKLNFYMEKTAKKMGMTKEELKNEMEKVKKGDRAKVLRPVMPRREKENNITQMLLDRLEAILVYGGQAGREIGLKMPEEEERLAELELVFQNYYEGWGEDRLKAEAEEAFNRYEKEQKMIRKMELKKEMEIIGENAERLSELLGEMKIIDFEIEKLNKKIRGR